MYIIGIIIFFALVIFIKLKMPMWKGKYSEKLVCDKITYSGAYPFTFRQPIKHKIAFKSTILYPFIP